MDLLNLLDPIGAFFALLCTYFSVKADIKTWPLGIIASLLDAILYFNIGLYADMSTSVLYIFMFIYGWYSWIYGGDRENGENGENRKKRKKGERGVDRSGQKTNLQVRWASNKILIIFSIIMLVLIIIISQLLIKYTNSKVPYWDAIAAVLSIGAQWLMCRKYIQTWFLWFIVDAMYVILYFNKHITWHSGLLLIYVFLAVAGFFRWNRLVL